MKINKYLPFAFIFFFINSAGLPYGLTFTALLAPFFYYWIVITRKKEPLLPFLAALVPFALVHFYNTVDTAAYAIASINYICVYIFCYALYTFLELRPDLEKIMTRLLYVNFILCLIAIPVYFTPWYKLFWIEQFLTRGYDNFRRFKMFTYEASHYASLFMPLFFFFLLQLVFGQNKIRPGFLWAMLLLPLVISFSLGVISAALLAIIITHLVYFNRLTRKKRVFNFLAAGLVLGIAGIAFLAIFFPHNVLFMRLQNIVTGNDSSGKGRTFEAFFLAQKIAGLKSTWWGIGAGQVKITGAAIIRDFYNYDENYGITIPNATAETLAIFGWIGLTVRLLAEGILFFRTRVWTNYYRLVLFVFVFIYQFTGSFVTNLAEYVLWILAFTPVFPQFDVRALSRKPDPAVNHLSLQIKYPD